MLLTDIVLHIDFCAGAVPSCERFHTGNHSGRAGGTCQGGGIEGGGGRAVEGVPWDLAGNLHGRGEGVGFEVIRKIRVHV